MSRIVLLFVLLFICSSSSQAFEFKTERMKSLYNELTGMQKNEIRDELNGRDKGVLLIPANNLFKNAKIRVEIKQAQIEHIGLSLQYKDGINSKYIEVYRFVETFLLAIYMDDKSTFALDDKDITVSLNGQKISAYSNPAKAFITLMDSCNFLFVLQNGVFNLTWFRDEGRKLSLSFPANINLIKGMTKVELEKEFVNNLSDYSIKNQNKDSLPLNSSNRIHQLPSGLFIVSGERFVTDDFRSDIYLSNAHNNLSPVFSRQFPVESFSNLFLTKVDNDLTIKVIYNQYGNKKEEITQDLNDFKSFLEAGNKVYFGLANDENNLLNGTIIYYNDIYNYIHLLVVEIDKDDFQKGNNLKIVNANLYTYIPRADLSSYNPTLH